MNTYIHINISCMSTVIKSIVNDFNNPNITIIDKINQNKITIQIKLPKISSYGSDIIEFNVILDNNEFYIMIDDSTISSTVSNVYLAKHIFNIIFKQYQIVPNTNPIFSLNVSQNNKVDNIGNKIKLTIDELIFCLNTFNTYITDPNEDYYRICPVCLKSKNYCTCILECCESCLPYSFDKIYNNIITDACKRDHNLLKLLLYTSLMAITNKSRFLPLPAYCIKDKYDPELLEPPNIHSDMNYYVDHIKNSDTDRILSTKINDKEFMLLKHIILSNNTRLNYYDNSGAFHDKTIDLWNELGDPNSNNNIILFTVDHPIEKQKQFNSNCDIVHVFHGSPIHNWYSIMRNGLKNYSGTDMMTHGQALGAGIYLASNISTSLGYCRNTNRSDYSIIGVVQILNSEKYKKSSGVYVVPDAADVLLKYLILLKQDKTKTDFQEIESYLTKELPSNIKNSIAGSYGITIKRLNKEHEEFTKFVKRLQKNNKQLLNVEINRNNMIDSNKSQDICSESIWEIELIICPKISINQQNNINYDNVIIDIMVKFPRSFPSSPCIITCNSHNIDITNVPMMIPIMIPIIGDKNCYKYTYNDPIMRYNSWRSDIRVHRVLLQMIQNILTLFKKLN